MSTRSKFLVVGSVLLGVGAVGFAVCIALLISGIAGSAVFVAMVFCYAIATMGLAQLLGALTSRQAREQTEVSQGRRSTPGHAGPEAGASMSFRMVMTTDSPMPAIAMAVLAVGLLIVTALTNALVERWASGLGVLVAVYIGWWAYRSFARYRRVG